MRTRVHFRGAWRLSICCLLVCVLGALPQAWAFDGTQALKLIAAQCDLGPRVPGTPAHAAWLTWAEAECKRLGLHTERQTFTAHLALTGVDVEATNLYAYAGEDGPTSPALVLSAHWDTRPYADQDPSGLNPPMLGANDGGSGVAAALELARVLRETRHYPHLVLAFWDAEDSGVHENLDSWALGARHAASHPTAWAERVALGINLDLVGGNDLRLVREGYSVQHVPKVVEELWRIGGDLWPAVYASDPPRPIVDDHLPWLRAGYAWANIIGLPWQHWHTSGDKLENCSAQSLQSVGDVVLQYIIGDKWKQARNELVER